jgi:flagellar basal body-associated protein FliL
MSEDIPSYAPSDEPIESSELNKDTSENENEQNVPVENNQSETSQEQGQESENVRNFEPRKNRNKKSKKKIIIPIIVILVLALGAESYFFFYKNKNINTINSYNYWFSTATPGCDTSITTNKPNSTPFFNQICGASAGYKYVNSHTNIADLSNGAIESYTINYQNDAGDKVILIASSFKDTAKQATYFNKQKSIQENFVWQNKSAVYSAKGANVAKFAESLNI